MSSLCVTLVDGVLTQDVSNTCEYLLLTKTEVAQLVESQGIWTFDSELYQYILSQSLATFVGGHVLGRILKYFGKL